VIDETTIYVIGFSITIIGMLGSVVYWLGGKFKEIEMRLNIIDERFKQVDERFRQIDERFKQIDKRFEQIDERFRQIEERLNQIDERFRQIDERFKQVDERFRQIDERFRQIDERFRGVDERFRGIEQRLDELRRYVDERFNELRNYIGRVELRVTRLAEAYTNYQEFFVEYLTAEGLIKREKADLLRNEARRMMRLAALANPLTKEEWERLKELLDKDPDKVTLEEALELRELARKVVREYGEYPEAWKLHIYASILVGAAIRRKAEESKQQGQQ
jgi:chromosome segregation ATPase